MSGTPIHRSDAARRAGVSLNTAAAVLLAAALVVMVNYLSYRHYGRTDWSRSQYYSLSDKTRSLLATLTNPVDVIVFVQPQQSVYEDVDNLLREYEYASKFIRVVRVDPDRDLARTEELGKKYQVDRANVIVFDHAGRSKYVALSDIVDYDYSPVIYGGQPEPLGFTGEQAFSSAIQSVTGAKRPVVYFLAGHGERDIDDFSRTGGYSEIAREVRRDNVHVSKLTLGAAQAIPDDCGVLVIAGPQKPFSEPEIDVIRRYLNQHGRVMFLLDAMTRTGLEPLLEDAGVRLADNVVVDATRTLSGRELFVAEYGAHPIVAKLKNLSSVFYLPRAVEPAAGPGESGGTADKPRATPLASCSEAGWAEVDMTENPMKFDVGKDEPGPVSVAVAVEKGPVPGIDVQIKPMRLVVFGDSDFVANGAMTGCNLDFFLSALNWLLEREELMAIAPKPPHTVRLVLTQRQLHAIFWAVVLFLPGLVAVLGALVWLRRRA